MILLLAFFLVGAPFQLKSPPPKKVEESTEGSRRFTGAHTLNDQIFDDINGQGLLKLHGTKVLGHLRVDGSLLARSARIGYLEVYGEANLANTTIEQASTIIGYLRAEGAIFKGALILGAQKAVFTNTKLQSITVRKETSFKGKQIIELKHKTIVDGPITFESGKGEIYLYPGSQILDTVTGAKIIRKN
ncbi:MAG: hypothetical protein KGJ02_01620 [Verrucomicrobiota bacterium]|nr:hypothetical protein [Verrucomicrobiota bacterium]